MLSWPWCIFPASYNTPPLEDQVPAHPSEAESYNNDGLGMVGDRYAVAMKPYYGAVGDYLNIVQEEPQIHVSDVIDL